MRQYEGMFIFDPTFANDFKNVENEVGRIIKRADGEIIVNRKWDERKLAYEINKRKRGCYVLTYFKAEPDRIAGIERDCGLSEHILRVMVLNVDDMSRERMEAMYPQRAAAAAPATDADGKPPADAAKADGSSPAKPAADDEVKDDAAQPTPVEKAPDAEATARTTET